MLSCPLVVALYCVVSLYGRQPRWRFADAAMAGVAVVIGVAYISSGVHQSQEIRARVARMELLVADGLSPETIGVRSAWDMQDDEQSLARHLEQMRAAKIGPYRHIIESLPTVDAEVQRLAEHHPAEAKRSKTTITATQPWVQNLRSRRDSASFALISACATGCTSRVPLPETLAWKIVEHDEIGAATERASGICDLVALPDPMFLPLRFDAITAKPSCRYELIIESDGKSSEVPLELPVFAADASCEPRELDGYVYLLRGERSSVAARDEDRVPRDAAPR